MSNIPLSSYVIKGMTKYFFFILSLLSFLLLLLSPTNKNKPRYIVNIQQVCVNLSLLLKINLVHNLRNSCLGFHFFQVV